MRAYCQALLVCLASAGCQHSDLIQVVSVDDPRSLSVRPSAVSMLVGADTMLSAMRADTVYSADRTIWTSSDTLVAVVSAQGLVHARKTGSAAVIATSRSDATLAAASMITVR